MYDINKLIEVEMQGHFFEFREKIRLEYKRVDKWYSPSKVKDKDKQFEIESYLKLLNDLTYTLDTLLLSDNPSCKPSVAHILKPVVEHYIEKDQLTTNVLKAF
jgi:hypothetical protein